MSLLKKLAGQTALYGLSSILGRVINFLFVPFYTSEEILHLAQFGAYTELYAYAAFLNIIYLYGMETTFFRYANREGMNPQKTFNIVQTAILGSSLFFSGLIILSAPSLATNLHCEPFFIIWIALILFTDAVLAVPFAKLRLENKASKFAFIKLSNIGLTVLFNMFFLVFCKQVYEGKIFQDFKPVVDTLYIPGYEVGYIFVANFLANALQLPFLVSVFKGFKVSFDKSLLKEMLTYSMPLMLMGLAGMVNEVLDRILITRWLPENFYPGLNNQEVLGVYGACYKLSMFMSLAVQAFRYAADPFFFSNAKDKNAPELFAKVMKWFVIVCALILVGVGANLEIFKHFLRSEVYWDGLGIVPILLLSNLFLGVYYNLSIWYKLTDKTQYGTYISFTGAGITIVGNIIMIPLLGYYGAAYATLICYFIMAFLSYWYGQKYYPIPYHLKDAAFYILTGLVITSVAAYYPWQEILYKYIFGFIGVSAFLTLIYVKEKKMFKTKV